MAEPIIEPVVEPVKEPTPEPAAEPTQPQAEKVDIDAITRVATEQAEKKMQAVFKSMLEQQGFDKETINKMAEEWKAKQVTPEQKIAEAKAEAKAAKAELAEMKQINLLKTKGIDDESLDFYQFKASKLAKEKNISFEVALDEYLQVKPIQATPPPFAVGPSKPIQTAITIDDYKKMSYNEKLKLKQEKPTIYEEFKKKLGF